MSLNIGMEAEVVMGRPRYSKDWWPLGQVSDQEVVTADRKT